MGHEPRSLTPWQQQFVDRFLSQAHSRSLLVAPPGTGKTATAVATAHQLLSQRAIDSVLVISDTTVAREQWRYAARQYGIQLSNTFRDHLSDGIAGFSTTEQVLLPKQSAAPIQEAALARRWFIVVDNYAYGRESVDSLIDRMLGLNTESRALFLSPHVPEEGSYEAEFQFQTESFVERSIIETAATARRIARFSPSFSLLSKLQNGPAAIDSMSWREFEKLVAGLLEQDGYAIELMKGSKDGNVDIVAVKDLGPNGYFKALWQAKKYALKNKVGISVIRELADTREEFRASKGIIVTSSYLTKGALQRVDRDKYILGKIDRDDLDAWIRRTLFGTSSPQRRN